ncbi:glycosyltransferase family 2 protein [Desulfosarcina sp. OttesenSCG-928-A07]|nr:glycosyltransferase family 2 protein [Desulfosarcina sp. OttesenSCG-928-G17]MDL2330187.1 glycosyltransferase family 2 protein [Desulfosarcina sp. OttesenSCG-928-A07]
MAQVPHLSLIIPFYNQRETLPYLFDSIVERAFPGLEVIVVDDASDGGCADIVGQYAQKGLPVRLTRHEKRQYTKNARITGIESATGKYVCFADADDVLWGDCLHTHMMMMEKNGADVLHFNAVFLEKDYSEKQLCHWTLPPARALYGKEIFNAFVHHNPTRGPSVWCRMFTRELCLKIIPFARKTHVLRYGEDLLLTTLLLFHAKNWLGSEKTGYGYRWEPDKPERIPGRLATLYYILTEVVPYLEVNGCEPDVLSAFQHSIFEQIKIWADKLGSWLIDDAGKFDETRFDSMFSHAGCEDFLKILMLCRHLELLAEQEKNKERMKNRKTLSFWKKISRKWEYRDKRKRPQ